MRERESERGEIKKEKEERERKRDKKSAGERERGERKECWPKVTITCF